MNDELKAKLIEYLGHLEQAAKVGKDFAAEQAPLAVQEYLRFSVVYFGSLLILAVLLAVAILIGYAIWWHVTAIGRGMCSDTAEVAGSRICGAIVTAGFLIVPGAIIGNCIRSFLLAWLAPRVFILEALADLVK